MAWHLCRERDPDVPEGDSRGVGPWSACEITASPVPVQHLIQAGL